MRDLRAVVAANIRKAASRRGMGANALADFAGVSRSQLYSVLNGSKSPTIDWLERVAGALEVEAWELLRPRTGSRG